MPTTAERLRELIAQADGKTGWLKAQRTLADIGIDCAEQIADMLDAEDCGWNLATVREALSRAIAKELDK